MDKKLLKKKSFKGHYINYPRYTFSYGILLYHWSVLSYLGEKPVRKHLKKHPPSIVLIDTYVFGGKYTQVYISAFLITSCGRRTHLQYYIFRVFIMVDKLGQLLTKAKISQVTVYDRYMVPVE